MQSLGVRGPRGKNMLPIARQPLASGGHVPEEEHIGFKLKSAALLLTYSRLYHARSRARRVHELLATWRQGIRHLKP